MPPVMSQSLPNQVNDFNHREGMHTLQTQKYCRNPFQTRSTTSMNSNRMWGGSPHMGVAIPSKPGQRLQLGSQGDNLQFYGIVAIPSKPGQRLQ